MLKNPSDLSRVRSAWDVAKESHFSPTTILMYRKQQAGHVVIPVTVASMIFPNCMLIYDLSLIYGGLFPFPYRLLLDVAAAKCIELSKKSASMGLRRVNLTFGERLVCGFQSIERNYHDHPGNHPWLSETIFLDIRHLDLEPGFPFQILETLRFWLGCAWLWLKRALNGCSWVLERYLGERFKRAFWRTVAFETRSSHAIYVVNTVCRSLMFFEDVQQLFAFFMILISMFFQ